MSEQTPWDKASDQVAELAISAISRAFNNLPKPSGSFEGIIKQACLDYAAQVEKERDGLRLELDAYKSVIDRICDTVGDAEHRNENVAVGVERIAKERDTLRARVEQMRKALETARALVVRHHNASFKIEPGCFCTVCHRTDDSEPEMDLIASALATPESK